MAGRAGEEAERRPEPSGVAGTLPWPRGTPAGSPEGVASGRREDANKPRARSWVAPGGGRRPRLKGAEDSGRDAAPGARDVEAGRRKPGRARAGAQESPVRRRRARAAQESPLPARALARRMGPARTGRTRGLRAGRGRGFGRWRGSRRRGSWDKAGHARGPPAARDAEPGARSGQRWLCPLRSGAAGARSWAG